MFLQKLHKPAKIGAILLLALLFGIFFGSLSRHVFSENARFHSFTKSLFLREVSGSTLQLHYTIAHPEAYGLKPAPITLGKAAPEDPKETADTLTACIQTLQKFDYPQLSRDNQMIYDMLLLYFQTELSLGDKVLLEEPLSPSLGIQAQLPVLLAEYAFYDEQDILDYLQLLTCIGPYFEDLMTFEQKKAAAGTFMSDTTLDRIQDQCSALITSCEDSYLTEIFRDKLAAFPDLSQEALQKYQTVHDRILTQEVFPAYEQLMKDLEALRGSGKNPYGLCYYEDGRKYYQYLLHSQTGVYQPIEEVKDRLSAQLLADSAAIRELLYKEPALLTASASDISQTTPKEALAWLEAAYSSDFPPLPQTTYEIKYVHPSMEDFSSPAFYLTPPIDTNAPNNIYINRSSQTSNLELFTTLAHEGFPGHLYQTLYFAQSKPEDIRQLLGFGGYVEGWATYAESFAYGYADLEQNLAALSWKNRSLNLCLYSLLDLGIHYYGWTPTEAGAFLAGFGITNPNVIQEIYQYIVETPGNYLKYYLGYLELVDLQQEMRRKEGNTFSLPDFHKKILEIGPLQFPVLRKYLLQEAS